jgi:hypothetical protein
MRLLFFRKVNRNDPGVTEVGSELKLEGAG